MVINKKLKLLLCVIASFSFIQYLYCQGTKRYDYDDVIIIKDNFLNNKSFKKSNATYLIEKRYNLKGSKIFLPKNCKLVFNGGVITGGEFVGDNSIIENLTNSYCLDNVLLTGKWGNLSANSDIFSFDKKGICKDSINAISLFALSNNIEFSEGIYCFSDIILSNNPSIKGVIGKTYIQATLKYPLVASSNNDVFVIKNCDKAIITGITFRGDLSKPWKAKYGGGVFIDCENVTNVNISDCSFSESCNYSLGVGKSYKGALINCYDCNSVNIERCNFSKSVKTEHIYIDVKNKKREECDVFFKNNHVFGFDSYFCGVRGNSILTAICNNLVIEDNLIEEFYYTGSIINCHGLHTIIKNNIVRNCRTTSVFDNCEYGEFWGSSFIAENNNVECYNALCFALQADSIQIVNNVIECFAGLVAKNNLTNGIKLNSNVIIKDNILNLSLYSKEESLPPKYWRDGINIESNYRVGGIAEIINNTIKINSLGQEKMIRRPIKILNIPEFSFCNNIVDTDIESSLYNGKVGVIDCVVSSSKTVPLDIKKINTITVTHNSMLSKKDIILLNVINESKYDNIEVSILNQYSNLSNQEMHSSIKNGVIKTFNNLDKKARRIIKTNVNGVF